MHHVGLQAGLASGSMCPLDRMPRVLPTLPVVWAIARCVKLAVPLCLGLSGCSCCRVGEGLFSRLVVGFLVRWL